MRIDILFCHQNTLSPTSVFCPRLQITPLNVWLKDSEKWVSNSSEAWIRENSLCPSFSSQVYCVHLLVISRTSRNCSNVSGDKKCPIRLHMLLSNWQTNSISFLLHRTFYFLTDKQVPLRDWFPVASSIYSNQDRPRLSGNVTLSITYTRCGGLFGNSAFYSGSTVFKSWFGDRLFWRVFLYIFFQNLQSSICLVPKIRPRPLLSVT
jgi:hypothetical protein